MNEFLLLAVLIIHFAIQLNWVFLRLLTKIEPKNPVSSDSSHPQDNGSVVLEFSPFLVANACVLP